MTFNLFNKDGEITHQSKSLKGIRRHVHKDIVDHVGVVAKPIGIFVSFKDGRYLGVNFASKAERDLTLKRWRNLKGVKRVDE